MSWGCPHQEGERCMKLKRNCEPTQRGCELRGKVCMQDPGVMGRSGDGTQSEVGKILKIRTKKA